MAGVRHVAERWRSRDFCSDNNESRERPLSGSRHSAPSSTALLRHRSSPCLLLGAIQPWYSPFSQQRP